MGVIKVHRGGTDGNFKALVPVSNIDAAHVERADVHAITIRLKQGNTLALDYEGLFLVFKK